jgi:hypothetical protein
MEMAETLAAMAGKLIEEINHLHLNTNYAEHTEQSMDFQGLLLDLLVPLEVADMTSKLL